MIVDHKSLQGPERRFHVRGGTIGQVIRKTLSKLDLNQVVEVGVGGNQVAEELKAESTACIAIGSSYKDETTKSYAFDLKKVATGSEIQMMLAEMPELSAGYLTSCLCTLPGLGRDQVSSALWNLREICQEYLLISVETDPSNDYNRQHQTVIPKRAWLRLVEALGFEVESLSEWTDFTQPNSDTAGGDTWSVMHWKKLNPFRDPASGKTTCLLLKKKADLDTSFEQFDLFARTILGAESRKRTDLPKNTRFTFLLGHYQEFLLFQPFFDQIPQDQFRVLIRGGAYRTLEERRLQSILAYLDARKINYEFLTSIDQVEWQTSDSTKEVLITAVDSTATKNHLINSAILECARAAGIPTFQLQHGLWPHAEFPDTHTVFCDHLLAWSEDCQKPFHLDLENQAETNTPPRHSMHYVGCPRFDAYADRERVDIADLLGEWATKFDQSVVVATNLHWPLHSQGSEVLPQLFQTAREMPRTLFICKMHPVHDYDDQTFAKMPPNVVVIDEFVSLYAELSTPRLINACDAVICTLSTVVLEAALAGKPFAILETGNPNHFEGTETVPIANMTEALTSLLKHDESNAKHDHFVQHYYCVPNNGTSMSSVIQVISNVIEQSDYCPRGIDIAVRTLALELLHTLEENYQLKTSPHAESNHSPPSQPGQDMSVANPPKESWRHLRKYARSIKKRMPWFQIGEAKIPTPPEPTNTDVVAKSNVKSKTPVKLGELRSREQFPDLLRELSLNGLGIELGVAAGAYSDFLLEHSDLRVLFSVDRWTDHHDDNEARAAHQLLSRHSVRSSVLKMTFDEASHLFADAAFDFIYLDGYAHLGQDGECTLTTWWNKLKPNGIFAGHDYHPKWPKTVEVVDQFTRRHGLELFTTDEKPEIVESEFPSWYVRKPSS